MKNLEFKAALLLVVMVLLVVGSAAYVMFARGVFEPTQRLVLISDDSEGVVVGMDMTFAGFAIGRVARIELADDGNARILVDVPEKDARWLRTSSIFTMERGLVGGTRLRAYSGVLDDPPLPDGAERKVLRGDTAAEIPKLVALGARAAGQPRPRSPLTDARAGRTAWPRCRRRPARLNGPQGATGRADGRRRGRSENWSLTIDRTNALLARADAPDRAAGQPGRQRRPPGVRPGRRSPGAGTVAW
ncbi:MAG: hypothetical protein U5L46_09725 [Agrobacterium sp.]|nr:hypothetical protein [Agrobacterium sp.]